jgi:hypothetical protein
MRKNILFGKGFTFFVVELLICSGLMLIPTQTQAAINNSGYDFIIITPVDFSNELQPLLTHKEQHAIATKIVTLDDIYNSIYFPVQGRDNAEKIKYFIKDAIDSWDIKYVLLMGDTDKIPMRKSYATGTLWSFKFILTDLYYADIYDQNKNFSSWDSNNNSIFGEFAWDTAQNKTEYIDDVDLYIDVGVGRLPVSNNREVKIVVNKIIQYETKSFGQQWFHRLILMGGDTFPHIGGIEGEIVTAYIASHMPDFEPVKLWMSLKTFNPILINKEISKGAGFVSFSGHGQWWGLATNRVNKSYFGKYYFTPYIFGLKNSEKLPVMLFDCCLTADLDFTLLNMKIPCFAWALVKKPSGGAIATIGFTESPYGGLVGDPLGGGSCRMNANFFDAYEPGILLSDMFAKAQHTYLDDLWKDCLTLEQCTLIGDPSLKIGGYSP